MSAPGPNWKYATTLALASVLILVVGWLIRPSDEAPAPAPATLLSESELVRLSRLAERRSLEGMTAYFAGIADDVDGAVVHLRPLGTTALVWDETTLVTAHAGHHHPADVVVATAAQDHATVATAWGPDVPVAAIARPDTAAELTPVRRRPAPPAAGDWVVAVWRTSQGRAFAMGHTLQAMPVTCGNIAAAEVLSSLSFVEPMAGGGLFDASGDLAGVILPCGGRLAAIVPSSVDEMLELAASLPQRLVARVGLVAGPMDPAETAHFGDRGTLLIREVWASSPAAAADLRPGDVILSLDEAAVASLDDLAPLTAPDRPAAALAVRRGRSTVSTSVPPAGAAAAGPPEPKPAPGAGLVWDSPSRGFPVAEVVPGSAAAAAGLRAGDRLLRIDGTAPQSMAQINRLLTAGGADPVFVEVERGSRRLGVLLR